MAEPNQIASYHQQTTRGSRLEGYRYTSKEFFGKGWGSSEQNATEHHLQQTIEHGDARQPDRRRI